MKRCLTCLLVLITVPCSRQVVTVAAQESSEISVESLGWIAGHWGSVEDGVDTEEQWMTPKAGMMPGVNRTINRNGRASFEFLRIGLAEKDGAPPRMVYYASPGGNPPVLFEMVHVGQRTVTFENLQNDFPQQIIYKREGDQMTVRIHGMLNGKQRSQEWHWNRLSDHSPSGSSR